MRKFRLKQRIGRAIALALAMGSVPSALAHATHRECEEDSSGSHRHASSGERIPCARDLLQDPLSTRDRDRVRDGSGRSDLGETGTGSDPGRDAIGTSSESAPPASPSPNSPSPTGTWRRMEKLRR